NTERKQPQHGAGQRNGDPIAAALDRAPAQRREHADCAEPTHHIVANRDDRRRFGMRGRPFDAEQSRYGCTDFIESGTILPRALVTVEKDGCMDHRELNGHQFVAGDRFTIADITALVAIDIGGRLADIKIAPKLAYLTRWHELVSSRPSAKA